MACKSSCNIRGQKSSTSSISLVSKCLCIVCVICVAYFEPRISHHVLSYDLCKLYQEITPREGTEWYMRIQLSTHVGQEAQT